jgi:hypothetical protein
MSRYLCRTLPLFFHTAAVLPSPSHTSQLLAPIHRYAPPSPPTPPPRAPSCVLLSLSFCRFSPLPHAGARIKQIGGVSTRPNPTTGDFAPGVFVQQVYWEPQGPLRWV